MKKRTWKRKENKGQEKDRKRWKRVKYGAEKRSAEGRDTPPMADKMRRKEAKETLQNICIVFLFFSSLQEKLVKLVQGQNTRLSTRRKVLPFSFIIYTENLFCFCFPCESFPPTNETWSGCFSVLIAERCHLQLTCKETWTVCVLSELVGKWTYVCEIRSRCFEDNDSNICTYYNLQNVPT